MLTGEIKSQVEQIWNSFWSGASPTRRDLLDAVPTEDRETKGDLYEHMLAKITTVGDR